MWNEFTNALAWFKAAPSEWIKSGKQNLEAAAEWIWNVLQGDFADEQSTAQVITGTVISMIPFVDQICDVRDIVANCRKINQDSSNKFAWVALALTLIGLFPCLGSLAKGCLKIPFNYARKFMLKGAAKALDGGLWKLTAPYIESSIVKLNQHLAHPAVRKALAALKIDNVWKYLAGKVREVKGMLTTSKLMSIFDELIDALKSFCGMIQKWGSAAMATKAGQLLKSVKSVRDKANKELAEVVKPLQDWLDQLARRLDVEADQNYRAIVKSINPHGFVRPSNAAELDAFEKAKPGWVDETGKELHPAARSAPVKAGHPNLDPPHVPGEKKPPLFEAYKTFKAGTIEPVTIHPGETLYRIVDPGSGDNSICWMRKGEFDELKSKEDWRRRFAVWANWNSNGEFVTYTVPPGEGLKVWEGTAATQKHSLNPDFKLQGGATQIVLDPKDLQKGFLGKRQRTSQWPDSGYDGFGEKVSMVGVPTLTNNWIEAK
ncbi:MAG TPA: hypothetical protein VLC92_21415 [Rhodocyclaceae bacterium]|nr:hypothetical protein [Rhodocyclaceae bacterium]